MQYQEEAKHIWKTMVPPSGSSGILQGELLRQVEKLRYEAQDNGNINWDGDFEYFCDFLEKTLNGEKRLPGPVRKEVRKALSVIKRYGQDTWRFNHGELSQEKLMKRNHGRLEFACVEDSLYDSIVDAVVLFSRVNPDPITYSPPLGLAR